MKNLAQLKKIVALPNTTLTLTATESNGMPAHKFLGITRKVGKIQTNGIYLVDPETNRGSWLDWGKASLWSFDGDLATYQDEWTTLTYKVQVGSADWLGE